MSESVKKSLEKSTNVLEEKRKNVKQKKLHKKDTHVYNNCYEFRSRAIKNNFSKTNLLRFGWWKKTRKQTTSEIP